MEIMTNSATNCPAICTSQSQQDSHFSATGIEPQDEEKGEKQASKDEATDKQVVRHLEHAADRFLQGWVVGRALNQVKVIPWDIQGFDFFDQLIEVLIPLGKEGRILIGSCLNSIAIELGSCI